MAVLAGALAKNHEVEILHHHPTMTLESLSRFAGVDLRNVGLRIPLPPPPRPRARLFWNRHLAERKADAELSKAYDLFITFTHEVPPYCAAPAGVLMVLFPSVDFISSIALAGHNRSSATPSFLRQLQSIWNKWQWQFRLHGYQVKAANSDFTRRWTKRRWNIDCQVVFPPVDIDIPPLEKSKRILSVGRFAISGLGKKQIEMLQTFKQLRTLGYADWHYDSAGGCGPTEEEQTFLKKATQLGAECNANIHANLSPVQLKRLYQQSKIFWHAAGLNVDEDSHPEFIEHFGMTTVEAMAAGCVPVVINKGGQPEIVEHGVSGFLWNTPEEWQNYTIRLMQDEALFQKMSGAARNRARVFSREAFVGRVQSMLATSLNK